MKTFKNKQITVLGTELKVGDQAPNFIVVNNDLEKVSLSDFNTTDYIVINVVPSLDTTVCELQTTTVNEELSKYENLQVITMSNDLPFAQKRWCGNRGLDNIITLSDYQNHDFGMKYGALIDELKLLARSIFVLDENRKVIYVDYANEMSQHLNYDSLLEFIDGLPGK
ncbi:MAG TPA: thiol peroxidase [Acholeplasmataceae bacterium]|nr:thiol peroxidase [Acholeplasmataceae bacterium]